MVFPYHTFLNYCYTHNDIQIIRYEQHFVPNIRTSIDFYTYDSPCIETYYKPYKHGSAGFCDMVVGMAMGTTLYPAYKFAP